MPFSFRIMLKPVWYSLLSPYRYKLLNETFWNGDTANKTLLAGGRMVAILKTALESADSSWLKKNAYLLNDASEINLHFSWMFYW